MKTLNNIISRPFIFIFIILVGFTGCIEEFGGVGEPFDKVEALGGTWNLTQVIQNDEDAIQKGFPAYVQRLDLTSKFPYSEYSLSLGVDENGSPLSFTETSGNAPALVGISSGTWTLDDPDHPSEITFSDGTNTTVLEIGSYTGLNEGVMVLKLTRSLNGKPFLSYNYTFEKE